MILMTSAHHIHIMQLTTDTIANIIWSCKASDLCAEGAKRIAGRDIFPHPTGNTTAVDPYTGTVTRGWFAGRLNGDEIVTVTPKPNGNGYTFTADERVLARVGNSVSGREGRRLRDALASF